MGRKKYSKELKAQIAFVAIIGGIPLIAPVVCKLKVLYTRLQIQEMYIVDPINETMC